MGRHESIFQDTSRRNFTEKYKPIFTPVLGKQLAVNTYYENDLIAPANTRITIELLQVFDELKVNFKVNTRDVTDAERNHALDGAMAQLIRMKRDFWGTIRDEEVGAIQRSVKSFIDESLQNTRIEVFKDSFKEVQVYLEFATLLITSDKKYIGTAAALKRLVEKEKKIFNLGDGFSGETIEHTMKTAWLALVLAESLGSFSEKECKILSVICMGHDCGKALIPESIIYKKGRLSQLENDIMKSHVLFSYIMMSHNQEVFDFEAFAMALHHTKEKKDIPESYSIAEDVFTSFHEYLNVDARQELKRIYEASKKYYRLIGIVDTFEAISTERVYKKASSIGKTLEIMTRSNSNGDFFYKPYLDRFIHLLIQCYLPVNLIFKITDELMEAFFDTPFVLPEAVNAYKKKYQGVIIKSCSTLEEELTCLIYNKNSKRVERQIYISPMFFLSGLFFR